jgi:hypothetical protein
MCSQRIQGVEDSRVRGFKGSSEMLKNYKELNVWQKSYELCLEIYRLTAKFPNEERCGLTSQIRRSAVSIPSNIAEGYGRKTTVDYIRMLYIGYSKKRPSRNRKNVKGADKNLENKHLNP